MKTKVLIIEDSFCKFFSTKQLIEAQLHVPVQAQEVQSGRELAEAAAAIDPDLIVLRPEGGVMELLAGLKKRGTNRRNTDIALILTADLEEGALMSPDDQLARRRLARAA